jgi:putative ABC transport system substrate-binding protein
VRLVGYLSPRSAELEADVLSDIREGMRATGNAEGTTLRIEARWADGDLDRLPALAAELAQLRPALIATNGGPQPARAARTAAPATPLVFASGSDPVRDGLVQNLRRPEGNVTGFNFFGISLGPKRLELLCELVPAARTIGFLVNPRSESATDQVADVQAAARGAGLVLYVASASTAANLGPAFASFVARGVHAVLISANTFVQVERARVVALAALHALPTMYEWPEFVAAGGLASYSTDRRELQVHWGQYIGRILNGTPIAELPVVQSTRFIFAVNLRTARALGITIPPALLARATEVIE